MTLISHASRQLKRDPEMVIMFGSLFVAAGGLGYWLGNSNGTAGQDDRQVHKSNVPWHPDNDSSHMYKYEYMTKDGPRFQPAISHSIPKDSFERVHPQ
ncbi:uncharacterized protein V1510DRAFT_404695 [Dipodascopsis tothii]|uniref:uncharacterized protein n=1 Tax=Dipodascopsis tothii TaxID=44089 RepID=UPI0034CD7C01